MLQGLRVLVRFEVLKPVHGADGEHTRLAGLRRQMLQHQLSELIQHPARIFVREYDDRVRGTAWGTRRPRSYQTIRDGDIRKGVGDRCNSLIKAEAAGDLQLTPRVRERIQQWCLLLEDFLVWISISSRAALVCDSTQIPHPSTSKSMAAH